MYIADYNSEKSLQMQIRLHQLRGTAYDKYTVFFTTLLPCLCWFSCLSKLGYTIYTLLTGHRLKLALVIMFCDALKKFLAYVDFPVYQKPGLHDLHMVNWS